MCIEEHSSLIIEMYRFKGFSLTPGMTVLFQMIRLNAASELVGLVGVYAHSALNSSNDWMKTYGERKRRAEGENTRAPADSRPSSPLHRIATFTYWTEKQHRWTRLKHFGGFVNLWRRFFDILPLLPYLHKGISQLSDTFKFKKTTPRRNESRSMSRSVRFGQDVRKAFKTHFTLPPTRTNHTTTPVFYCSLTTLAGEYLI